MKTRFITIFILAALMLSLLAACGSDKTSVLTPDEVQKIALEHAGLSVDDVTDIHLHVAEGQKVASYSVHITIGDQEYEYIIAAVTGEILHADDIQ